jgi:hypothetical protein
MPGYRELKAQVGSEPVGLVGIFWIVVESEAWISAREGRYAWRSATTSSS